MPGSTPPGASNSDTDLLLRIAEVVSAPISDGFLEHLVYQSASILDTPSVLVADTCSHGGELRSRILLHNGEFRETEQIPVNHTPHAQVLDGIIQVTEQHRGKLLQGEDSSESLPRSYAGAPLRDEHGDVIGILAVFGPGHFSRPGMMHSILSLLAGRASAEITREAMEKRIRLICQTTTDAIYEKNLVTGKTWWNQTESDSTPSPQKGDWSSRIHPDDYPSVMSSFESACNSDTNHWKSEYRLADAADQYLHVLDRARILRDSRQRATHVIGGISDISERKSLEQQLLHATRLESIGKLAGGVAHDFNNLLTVILSGVDYALEELRPDEPVREDLEDVRDAGRRAAELTRQLLAFSRQQYMEPTSVDLNALISGVSKMLRRLIGDNIRVENRLDPTIKPILADPGHIEQVILNMAVNAREAMPDGGVLTISTSNHRPSDGPMMVELSIADTGRGIDGEDIQRIFEPFYTTAAPGEGSGLGLAAVHGIIIQSGGSIEATSEPGHGSCFHILLPVSTPDSKQAPVPAQAQAPRSGERILIVEDDEQVSKMTASVLAAEGYTVDQANSAEQAIELIEKGLVPTLVISDRMMPGMSGVELAGWLTNRLPQLPIILTSGYSDLPDTQPLGHHVHRLAKPYTIAGLRDLVREALQS